MIVEELEVMMDKGFEQIAMALNLHSESLLDLNKLLGMQREMLERHLERIETLEDEAGKHTEELGGQLKIIGDLITKLDQQAEKIDGLEYTHRQYSDHMNQGG